MSTRINVCLVGIYLAVLCDSVLLPSSRTNGGTVDSSRYQPDPEMTMNAVGILTGVIAYSHAYGFFDQ